MLEDVHGSSVLGVNYPRRKSSACNYLGSIVLGWNFPGGGLSGGICPRWQLSRVQLSRGRLSCSRMSLILFKFKISDLQRIASAANKYFSSANHHEQKNKKVVGKIKFSAVAIRQRIKLVLHHYLCK